MEDSMPHAYRILFLMAETGAGHRSAAEAIRSAIHLLTATPGQHGELDADDAVAQAHMSCAYHREYRRLRRLWPISPAEDRPPLWMVHPVYAPAVWRAVSP